MKKYPNINRYFNRKKRNIYKTILILYGIMVIFMFLTNLSTPDEVFYRKAGYYSWTVLLAIVVFYLYKRQVNLEKVKLGKHLTKYYGLEGTALREQIAKIDAEVGKPLYADAMDKNRHNAFFVTQNWLVGTDGIAPGRLNACKRSDIINMEKKVIDGCYYTLQVTDKNNYIYEFWLRSRENVIMAYDFLTNSEQEQ